jgi:hypothetical protein
MPRRKKVTAKAVILEDREQRRNYTHCEACDRPLDVEINDLNWAKQFLQELGHTVTYLSEGLYAIDHGTASATYRIGPTLVATARRLEADLKEGKKVKRRVRKGVSTSRIEAKGRKTRSDKGERRKK